MGLILGINAIGKITDGAYTQFLNFMDSLNNIPKSKLINFTVFITRSNYNALNTQIKKSSKFQFIIKDITEKGFVLRMVWQQLVLPFYIMNYKINKLFSASNIAPFFCPVESTVMLQNAMLYAEPKLKESGIKKWIKQMMLKGIMAVSCKRADKVVTTSEYCRELIISQYKKNPRDVLCAYYGVDHFPSKGILRRTVRMLSDNRFILLASHLSRHKNSIRQIKAFGKFASKVKDVKLVIAGRPRDKKESRRIEKIISEMKLGQRIVLTGNCSAYEMAFLYKKCLFLVFPSLMESFGLPLGEAMYFKKAIACSNIMPMPEICGKAAVYFDPYDVLDIKHKMIMLYKDKWLRERLGSWGFMRSKMFIWKKNNDKLMSFIIGKDGHCR